jgi:hypothetical protein
MLTNVTTSTVTGRPNVDFVWGNFPLQPNDERTSGTPSATVTVGGAGNVGWTTTSTVNSAYLSFTQDTENIAEANYSGFPSFIAADPVLRVTAASGNGTTVTYTAQSNGIVPASLVGQNVTITGLTNSAFNLTNATIASATAYQFTVTNSAGSGVSITGQTAGIAQLGLGAADSDGSFVSGVAYVTVPSVIGKTTANATAQLLDIELVPTTASSYTPAISNVVLTSNVVTVTTAAAHGFAVGDSVTVAAVTNTAINGTFTISAVTSTTFSYALTHANIATGADTGTSKVAARSGTIYSQSVAAGTASVSAGAAITITPFA